MRSVTNPFSTGASARKPGIRLLAWLLFVSGAVALVYEIAWQRQFALVFGSSAPATAAVLAAYFAGLGLGSFFIGRRADTWARPLRAYAVLELAVGLGALLVSPLLGWFERIYPWLFQTLSGQAEVFVAARVVLAFVVLLVPTFCMGGTLPLLGRLIDQGRHQLGQTAGWLYVANTLGAALGALLVPFVLLAQLGLANSIWLGAALNFGLALIAWWLDRKYRPATGATGDRSRAEVFAKKTPERPRQEAASLTPATPPVLLPGFLSGGATFALQVLWNRAFAQVHENSMYSFAVTVAIVILALAIGAQLARFRLRRGDKPNRLLGLTWMLGGLAVMIGPMLFLRLSGNLGYLTAGGWTGHALQLTERAAAVLLIPMALLGVGLPALMEQTGQTAGEATGRSLGRLLAANVLGSVAGALVAGFLLPAWLGLWHSLLWLGALLIGAGWWMGSQRTYDRPRWKSGLLLAAAWIASLWPITRLDLPRVRVGDGERLLAVAEGTHGITAVVERPGSRRLKLNNHYGLGGTASTGDERMQAHVPLLLHPDPKRVAFLGLGTGITAGGAMFHPIERLTVMELVPEVVAAARTHFREANAGVLDALRTRVVQDDARNFLRGSGEQFDVIIGDLVVPWRQGEGSLFTREQFAAARGALAPGGLFCQWLPLFQLSEQEVAILTRTFLSVFPRAQVWRGDFSPDEPAIALIGYAGERPLDVERVRQRLAGMQPDPANPQLQIPEAYWMNLIGLLEPADLAAAEFRINTEDRPWVELLGPMLHAGGDTRALFTGRRLQAWLERIRLNSRARLGPLPGQEASVEAGSLVAEMVLCLSEQNTAGAQAAQMKLRQTLPEAVYRKLFP